MIVEKEMRLPKDGQVLVKVQACGICKSDDIVRHGESHGGGIGVERTPGHEIVGMVVAVPLSEKNWKVGDRVGSGWHGGHDGTCDRCTRGDFGLCKNATINGINVDGGYAEYVLLRPEGLARIPMANDAAKTAPLLCAGLTVYNSLRHMNITAGGIVAVQGVGGLGHLAIQFAHKMGYRAVAISHSDSKESLAKELGAEAYIDTHKSKLSEELQKMGGAECIMYLGGSDADEMIKGMAPGGTLLVLALNAEVKFNSTDLLLTRLKVAGWPAGTAKDSEDTIAFASRFGVECSVEKFKFEDVEKAYTAMTDGSVRFRSVIVME